MRATICGLVVQCALLGPSLTGAANLYGQSAPAPLAVWDTKNASADRLSTEDLAKNGTWERKSRNQKAESFQGDAVVANGRILAVVRKAGAAVDIYSGESEKPVWRMQVRLQAVGGDPAARLERVALVENTRAAARLEAVYKTANGDAINASFRLKRGGISLEISPGPGAEQLRVDCPGRYVVLPDFFADDILIDARRIPVARAEIPSENFLLHLTGIGDAVAMCVFEHSDQDVQVTIAGEGDRRIATGSEIQFGEGGKVWVALMDGPDIWHAFDVDDEDAGKIIPLGWKMPFPAQWRTDFTRRNDLTNSWEMLYPAEDGDGYIKPSWLPSGPRRGEPSLTATGEIDVDAYKVGGPASNRLGPDRERWITVLGRYRYPCWTDQGQMGFVQPLEHRREDLMFRGPAVIYPINRLPETPIDTYTAVDVVRSTLGVGPCEYILSVEGQRQDHVGRATCHVRRLLNEIYESKQQKSRREEIEIYLGDGLDFVKHIRHRIDQYIEFGHEMGEYLAAQKKAHPELAGRLTEMEKIVRELDERLEKHRDGIKSPQYVVALNNAFRKNLLNYEGSDALVRLKEYTDALTRVGGNQDSLVGECRSIVRTLRQRAALTMAVDPRFGEIGEEIRARTQEVLLKPSAYEGARQ
jgi:hypothetical protein